MYEPFQLCHCTSIFGKGFWTTLDGAMQRLGCVRMRTSQDIPLPKVILSFASLVGLVCRSYHTLRRAIAEK